MPFQCFLNTEICIISVKSWLTKVFNILLHTLPPFRLIICYAVQHRQRCRKFLIIRKATALLLRHSSSIFFLRWFLSHGSSFVWIANNLIHSGNTLLRYPVAKSIMDANSRTIILDFCCNHRLSFLQVDSLATMVLSIYSYHSLPLLFKESHR